jgi:hypothetical protein
MNYPRNIIGLSGLAILSLALGACTSMGSLTDFSQIRTPKLDTSTIFIPNPTQFAPKQESATPITPGQLVDGSGYCADMGAPPAPAPSAENPGDPAAAPAAMAPTGRNVALEMSECEVVRSMGRPGDIQITANQRGDRMVTMTYLTPERPIYRFVAGRLASIERGAEPPPPEPVKKKPAKKPAAKKRPAAAPPA